jgi:hypothetical protein
MPSALFYVLTSLSFREDLTLEARLPLSGLLGNSEAFEGMREDRSFYAPALPFKPSAFTTTRERGG